MSPKRLAIHSNNISLKRLTNLQWKNETSSQKKL
uniref:Uncharacterized protein n=1 Tax=Rhizophora mucronata TaxID=61149 RepID=A0A2P2QDR5_RHIMU